MKYRMFLLVFTLISAHSQTSRSFVNIESLRQSDEMGLLGSVGLKANGASGNTNKFNSSLGLNNIYRNQNHEYILVLNYFYSEVSSAKNTNRGQAHIRYSRTVSLKHAIEAFSQIEFDDFKALRYRSLVGLGWRYRPLRSKTHRLAIGVGAFYESEEFESLIQYNLVRINLYASYEMSLSKTASLGFVNYLQPAFEDFENVRFRSSLNLDLQIYKNISMSTDLRYIYDSNLRLPIRKGDFVYMTGVKVKY